ncbi:hypothetical protein ACIA49_40400 [Kribbella sp. NPDC051587]|uniref:hypothetical protein n=1 Tax=Kribbella sp. NPDC051587 TaxID=3364119 RepID=UPI0037A2A8EC
MRKLAAIGTTALLLTAGLPTSAWAADPVAPTDVQVAWAGDKVRVTWNDDGAANEIWTRYPGTGFVETSGRTVAGGANELLIDRSRFMDLDRAVIYVFARKTTGENGPMSPSVEFDTRIPVYPIIEDANLLADGSVQLVRWKQPAIEDKNPNDPLDRPASDTYLGAQIAVPGSPVERMPIPAGSTSFTVPPRPRPAKITLYAGNEWREASLSKDGSNGPWLERAVEVGTMTPSFTVPALGSYSQVLDIDSTLKSNLTNISTLVHLQARPNSTAPWKTYGRYDGNVREPFDTHIASLGGRQYRLWVLPSKQITQSSIKLTPAASTTAKSSKTIAWIYTRGIIASKARAGRMVNLKVNVQPALDLKAALQKWDGKQWRYVRELALRKGAVSIQFRATAPAGTTRYRVLTPAVKVNGLPVLATSTSYFTLTVY